MATLPLGTTLLIVIACGTFVGIAGALILYYFPSITEHPLFQTGGASSVKVAPEGEEDMEEVEEEEEGGSRRSSSSSVLSSMRSWAGGDAERGEPELDSAGQPVKPARRKVRYRKKRLTEEELEALCARSGFTRDEVMRLHGGFQKASRGEDWVDPEKLLARLPDLAGPLLPRLPGALKVPTDKPINFVGLVSALGVFCERAPADDKVRLLFRLCDGDGDGKIGRADLRGLLDLVLPASPNAEEREQLLDCAVENCFAELAGSRSSCDEITVEQFAGVTADLAGERGTIFF